MAENQRRVLWALSPRPGTSVTFKVDPDCADFCNCKENSTPLTELLSRDLIGLRAACARVAHMSGAVEQIDQIYRNEEEDTTVSLAYDGNFLSSLLNARMI